MKNEVLNIKNLIANAESFNTEEKQRWLNKIPTMKDKYILRLYNILKKEKILLKVFRKACNNEIKKLLGKQ